MKIFIKVFGVFFLIIIAALSLISVASHARVHSVQMENKEDISKMLIKHEEIKKIIPSAETKP